MSQQDQLPLEDQAAQARETCAGPDCALPPGSASLPDDEWMLDLVNRLGHALEHRTGDSITVPLDLLAHAQSALITHLGIWRDSARLNWLDGRGAQWTVRMQGVEMGTGRIRDAINMAILRVECGPNKVI